jgi:hypothetical protein
MSNWRPVSWLMAAWLALPLVALFWAMGQSGRYEEAGRTVGELAWPWGIALVVLVVIWRRTRHVKSCPRCGLGLERSATYCTRCGYYPGMPVYPVLPGMPGTQYPQQYPPATPYPAQPYLHYQQLPGALATSPAAPYPAPSWPPAAPIGPSTDPAAAPGSERPPA